MTNQTTNLPIPYEIPIEGSLGLLALGAVGLQAWRQKRDLHQKNLVNTSSATTLDNEKEKS